MISACNCRVVGHHLSYWLSLLGLWEHAVGVRKKPRMLKHAVGVRKKPRMLEHAVGVRHAAGVQEDLNKMRGRRS